MARKISNQEAAEKIKFLAEEKRSQSIYLMSIYKTLIDPPSGYRYECTIDDDGAISTTLKKKTIGFKAGQ